MWSAGYNGFGQLGLNSRTAFSSPKQVGSETTWSIIRSSGHQATVAGIKTDGTLWMWGQNHKGNLGQNNVTKYSSPTQVPGTTWDNIELGNQFCLATKTDGTLWAWGQGGVDVDGGGWLGTSPGRANYSSPIQIPGTVWRSSSISAGGAVSSALTYQ